MFGNTKCSQIDITSNIRLLIKAIQFILKIWIRNGTRSRFVKYIEALIIVNKSRRLRWAGHVARMEEGWSAFKILTDKPKGKRPLAKQKWPCRERYQCGELGWFSSG